MAKVTKITTSLLTTLREEIDEALAPVLKKYGMSAHTGNARYNDVDATFKLKVMLGSNDDAAQRDWDRVCRLYGLKPEDFGSLFESGGVQWEICGIQTRSRKYPILAKNENGTIYKFTADEVRRK